MWLGWETVDAEKLKGLDSREFENLIRALVDAEALERWSPADVVVEGPPPEYVADGNCDIVVDPRAVARESAGEFRTRRTLPLSILGDPVVGNQLAISCKTGKTSIRNALRDVASGGERARDILRAGGGLLVATTEILALPKAGTFTKSGAAKKAGASAKPTKSSLGTKKASGGKPAASGAASTSSRTPCEILRDDLAREYAAKLAEPGLTAEVLARRIRVMHAPDLALYIARLRPTHLPESIVPKLGVQRETNWSTFDAWQNREQVSRAWPDFVRDDHREVWVRQIVEFLGDEAGDAAERAVVVLGPPGVGKTRLVIESIRERGYTTHACVAIDATRAAVEIGRVLHGAPSAVLVVDDCPPSQVSAILEQFTAAWRDEAPASAHSRLIVIVPGARPVLTTVGQFSEPLEIEPLDPETAQKMIRNELGPNASDDHVRKIHKATEGYPWFAILVAREVNDGSAVPVTSTQAARLAIAMRHDQERRPAIVTQRARALLAVMLADSPPHDSLSDAERDSLARAVDLRDGRELRDLLEECRQRGVLRIHPRYYVTPEILEREVWRILNSQDSPDPNVPRRLREHAGSRMERFLARLDGLRFDPGELRELAVRFADDLGAAVRDLADTRLPGVGAMAMFCSRHAPHAIAPLLHEWIARATHAELLGARAERRWIVRALRAIARAGGEFRCAESALFRLRLAENQGYVSNASAVWTWLFLPWMRYAPEPFELRFATLQVRCRTGSSSERASATAGLGDIISGRTMVVTDGVEEDAANLPVGGDAAEHLRTLWSLLVELVSDDDPAVADVAQRAFAEHLRRAADAGLLVGKLEDAVFTAAGQVTERHRVALRRELEFERRAAPHRHSRAVHFWERLAAQIEPRSFGQRLRDRLGLAMSSEHLRGEVAVQLDEAVVREGLAPPERPLLAHLPDFADRGAQRAGPVMITVGRLDDGAHMLPLVVAHTRESQDAYLLSTYCVGQWEASRHARVRAWIDAWRHEATLATGVVETIARIGPDDAWLQIASELIRSGAVGVAGYRMLEVGRWPSVSPSVWREFLQTAVECGAEDGARLALTRIYHNRKNLERTDLEFAGAILGTVAWHVLRGGEAWTFWQCGVLLLNGGVLEPACRAAVRAASLAEPPGDGVWSLLEACARSAPAELWGALSAQLAKPAAEGELLAERLAWHDVMVHLPAPAILEWIGGDRHRALLIAGGCTMRGEMPTALERGLLEHFGDEAAVARELSINFANAMGAGTSLVTRYDEQIARAERWAKDDSTAVRAWAVAMVAWLRSVREREAERERAERRGVGT